MMGEKAGNCHSVSQSVEKMDCRCPDPASYRTLGLGAKLIKRPCFFSSFQLQCSPLWEGLFLCSSADMFSTVACLILPLNFLAGKLCHLTGETAGLYFCF